MESEEYYIPLEDQKIFGAGIKRKRIAFVSAQDPAAVPSHSPSATTADKYLDIVLRNRKCETADKTCEPIARTGIAAGPQPESAREEVLCDICNLPISSLSTSSSTSNRPHEASISHQVCLAHSRPPSHLNRDRHGLKYLSSYGWDPDSRLGLGTAGEGIREPLKVKAKIDTAGLGVIIRGRVPENKIEKLDAGQVRKMAGEERKRVDGLREMFWGNDEVARYLGCG